MLFTCMLLCMLLFMLLNQRVHLKLLSSIFPRIKMAHQVSLSTQKKRNLAYFVMKEGRISDLIKAFKFNNDKFNSMFYLTENINEVNESDERTPLYTNDDNSDEIGFDSKLYFETLRTVKFGHYFIFTDITSTTMTMIEPFTAIDGFIVIANQQVKGRGRKDNVWISPKGSCSFTLHFCIPLNSKLGKHLGFTQHLAALAIVNAVKRISSDHSIIDLKVKWPNDVYWGKKMAKLCGILACSMMVGNTIHCFLGIGINISNSFPSGCFNDVIDYYNKEANLNLNYIAKEELIARFLNEFEILIDKLEMENGFEILKQLYIENWIHKDQIVTTNDNKDVKIVGIDEHGYLLALELTSDQNSKMISLEPDGNSLDMLENLVKRK